MANMQRIAALGLVLIAIAPDASRAVTVTATQGGGPSPQQLAAIIADSASNYTVVVGSATTVINNGSSTLSSPRSMGSFANGLTAAGTPLPPANDGSPAAVYAGGVGVADGVCMCTGAVTDSDAANPGVTGRGVGVEGPNNGIDSALMENPGEISEQVLGPSVIDSDFDDAVFNSTMTTDAELQTSGDPTVLQFDITLTSPGYLRISTVFGSDEYDAFIDREFNDSFAILVKSECKPYENIALLNKAGVLSPFNLQSIRACGPPQFKENQVAPEPAALPPSDHAIDNNSDGVGDAADGVSHFDHEFAGFTALRTWETQCPLAPATYTVKIVIHDVGDARVDAGLFIMQDSLKLYAFLPADFNLDGKVDVIDFGILSDNWGQCGKKFTEGDASGDCCVGIEDYGGLSASWGQTGGNRDLRFDFNRDNQVDGTDLLLWQQNVNLDDCASRFEGDSDGDGDVDGDDEPDDLTPADPCGGGGEELTGSGQSAPADADIDQDGDVDYDDVKLFGEMMADEN